MQEYFKYARKIPLNMPVKILLKMHVKILLSMFVRQDYVQMDVDVRKDYSHYLFGKRQHQYRSCCI